MAARKYCQGGVALLVAASVVSSMHRALGILILLVSIFVSMHGAAQEGVPDSLRRIDIDSWEKAWEMINAFGAAESEEEMIAIASRMIEIAPDEVHGYRYRAAVRQDTGDVAGALADWNKLIEVQPLYSDAYYNRSMLKKAMGDEVGAATDLQLWKKVKDNGDFWLSSRL